MIPFDPSLLLPGDCLLYRPSSFFGWAIAAKTFCRLSHVEVYIGNGKSFASRDGKGVGVYDLRTSGLGCVRRPITKALDLTSGIAWAKTVDGEAYDFRDLFTFLLMGKPSGEENKMICSEAATWLYREMGFDSVNKDVNAEAIAPSDLFKSATLVTIWHDGQ